MDKNKVVDIKEWQQESLYNRVEVINYYNKKGRGYVFWQNDAEIEIEQ